MELEIGERLAVLNILPEEGDFTTMKIIQDLKNELGFTEEEHKAYNFKVEGTSIFWDGDGAKPKDIKFGEIATKIITDKLKKLNEERKLRSNHLTLYEKFVKE